MEEYKVHKEDLQKAEDMAKELGGLRNSITKGQGNLAGFLGEVVVARVTGSQHKNTYDYDLVSPAGHTVDVKTKRTNYPPKDYYSCSVAGFNTRQKCDVYCFVRVKNDMSKVWILGYYPKERYFQDATFHKKGEVDPDNSFTFKADCYNLPINQLVDLC